MVSLSVDELVLYADPAKYQGIEGVLCLTNRKLAFDYQQRGIFFTGQHSAVVLPIEKISYVSVAGIGPFKRLIINALVDFSSFGTVKHEFKVDNPEKWKERIEQAKGAIKKLA